MASADDEGVTQTSAFAAADAIAARAALIALGEVERACVGGRKRSGVPVRGAGRAAFTTVVTLVEHDGE